MKNLLAVLLLLFTISVLAGETDPIEVEYDIPLVQENYEEIIVATVLNEKGDSCYHCGDMQDDILFFRRGNFLYYGQCTYSEDYWGIEEDKFYVEWNDVTCIRKIISPQITYVNITDDEYYEIDWIRVQDLKQP
jgi:hypothetical protein